MPRGTTLIHQQLTLLTLASIRCRNRRRILLRDNGRTPLQPTAYRTGSRKAVCRSGRFGAQLLKVFGTYLPRASQHPAALCQF
jgi:hypothetical protein